MQMKLLPLATFGLGWVGCASPRPDTHIQMAATLVEGRLAHRPRWDAPWDASPPDWSAESVLPADEAVALALRNNRMLRADLEMIGQANAELVQAGLLQNPALNLMVMFPDGGGRAMLRSSALPMQPLQDLWLIPARKEVATAELQQAVLRVADRAVETAATVRTTYVKLQFTRRAIALVRENMELAAQTTRIVEVRQTAGQATQAAVNLAHIRYQRLRSELLAMEAEYREMQRELLMLMGFAGAPDRWTVAPLDEEHEELKVPEDEEPLMALGAEQRLDLRAARWRLEAAEHRITLMRREGWPEVALGFTAERAPAPRASRGPTIPARVGNAAAQAIADRVYGVAPMPTAPMIQPWVPKMYDVKWTLGPMLELELPIFDQNQAQVAKAMHEYNQKLAEYEARAQEITRDVRAALVRARTAKEQVEFYRVGIVPDVERNLDLAQQAFVAGQEDLTVYLQAQEDLIMTRRTILEFLRDYHIGRVDLERAVGGRLEQPAPADELEPDVPPPDAAGHLSESDDSFGVQP